MTSHDDCYCNKKRMFFTRRKPRVQSARLLIDVAANGGDEHKAHNECIEDSSIPSRPKTRSNSKRNVLNVIKLISKKVRHRPHGKDKSRCCKPTTDNTSRLSTSSEKGEESKSTQSPTKNEDRKQRKENRSFRNLQATSSNRTSNVRHRPQPKSDSTCSNPKADDTLTIPTSLAKDEEDKNTHSLAENEDKKQNKENRSCRNLQAFRSNRKVSISDDMPVLDAISMRSLGLLLSNEDVDESSDSELTSTGTLSLEDIFEEGDEVEDDDEGDDSSESSIESVFTTGTESKASICPDQPRFHKSIDEIMSSGQQIVLCSDQFRSGQEGDPIPRSSLAGVTRGRISVELDKDGESVKSSRSSNSKKLQLPRSGSLRSLMSASAGSLNFSEHSDNSAEEDLLSIATGLGTKDGEKEEGGMDTQPNNGPHKAKSLAFSALESKRSQPDRSRSFEADHLRLIGNDTSEGAKFQLPRSCSSVSARGRQRSIATTSSANASENREHRDNTTADRTAILSRSHMRRTIRQNEKEGVGEEVVHRYRRSHSSTPSNENDDISLDKSVRSQRSNRTKRNRLSLLNIEDNDNISLDKSVRSQWSSGSRKNRLSSLSIDEVDIMDKSIHSQRSCRSRRSCTSALSIDDDESVHSLDKLNRSQNSKQSRKKHQMSRNEMSELLSQRHRSNMSCDEMESMAPQLPPRLPSRIVKRVCAT